MSEDRFEELMEFVHRLEQSRISFRLAKHLEDAICVEVHVPGERWEVDFLEDGEVYVERFRSDGHIDDESAFAELFAKFAEESDSPSEQTVNCNAATINAATVSN